VCDYWTDAGNSKTDLEVENLSDLDEEVVIGLFVEVFQMGKLSYCQYDNLPI